MILDRSNRNNKIIALFLVLLLISGTLFTFDSSADTLDDINDQISDKEDELEEGEKQIEELADRINALNSQIGAAKEDIAALELEIEEAEIKVAEAEEKLEKKQEELDEGQDELNVRLRNMYKNGSMGFIDILLSSADINDLFINYDMVQLIYASDQELVDILQRDYEVIESEIGNLEAAKAELEDSKTELKVRQEDMIAAEEALSIERSKISDENLEIEKQIQNLESEADRLTAELEGESEGDYVGGELAWPTSSKYITSYYGYRPDPFGGGGTSWHSGIDISAYTGAPIYAANSGRVYFSGWNNGGYGYLVMIDHGGGMITMYAHNSKLLVKEGEWVSRGERIANAGSTGYSTGPHLHFEVRINGVRKNPLNYL